MHGIDIHIVDTQPSHLPTSFGFQVELLLHRYLAFPIFCPQQAVLLVCRVATEFTPFPSQALQQQIARLWGSRQTEYAVAAQAQAQHQTLKTTDPLGDP